MYDLNEIEPWRGGGGDGRRPPAVRRGRHPGHPDLGAVPAVLAALGDSGRVPGLGHGLPRQHGAQRGPAGGADGPGASAREVQWVYGAFALVLSALLLVGGTLGDRFGRRRAFVLGAAVFAAASVWCALAPGPGQLVAARAVQGAGGALLVPASLAIVGASFEGKHRAKAIGAWAALSGTAMAVGPRPGRLAGRGGLLAGRVPDRPGAGRRGHTHRAVARAREPGPGGPQARPRRRAPRHGRARGVWSTA